MTESRSLLPGGQGWEVRINVGCKEAFDSDGHVYSLDRGDGFVTIHLPLNLSNYAFKCILFIICQLYPQENCLRKTKGASLVAQWLRICLPMQGTRVRALVWEDPTCRGATRPVSHNY